MLSQGWQCPQRRGEPAARRAGPAGSRDAVGRPAAGLGQRPPGDVAPGGCLGLAGEGPGGSGQQRGGKLSSALGSALLGTRHWQRLDFQWQGGTATIGSCCQAPFSAMPWPPRSPAVGVPVPCKSRLVPPQWVPAARILRTFSSFSCRTSGALDFVKVSLKLLWEPGTVPYGPLSG